MGQPSNRKVLDFNAPVILGLAAFALVSLVISGLTGGAFGRFLAVRYTSWADPLMYLRLFTHILPHADLAHYTGNFLMILAVGPIVEEKYGSFALSVMICITALVTGLVNVLFFRHIMLMGASGIVFMVILLASFVNLQQGKIPLTVLLVGLLYIGNEIVQGLLVHDNVSRISHILGGLLGAGFGYMIHRQDIKG